MATDDERLSSRGAGAKHPLSTARRRPPPACRDLVAARSSPEAARQTCAPLLRGARGGAGHGLTAFPLGYPSGTAVAHG